MVGSYQFPISTETRSFLDLSPVLTKKIQIIILTTREILSREIVPKVQFAKVYLAKSFSNFPNSQKFIQNKSANLFSGKFLSRKFFSD